MAGGLIVALWRQWTAERRWGRKVWLILLLSFNLNDPVLQFVRGTSEIRFARQYYARFDQRLHHSGVQPPALILIRPDPTDRHRDLVTNSPSLDDSILRARVTDTTDVSKLLNSFPDRQVWFYDAKTDQLGRLQNPSPADTGS
jgi:hypothetical protein